MRKKTALIFGVGGQDGSFLAEQLSEKEYNVCGVIRRNATGDLENAKHLEKMIDIVEGDITDMASVLRIVESTHPHEIYNLAAMSHVHTSFEQPMATLDINTKGLVNILEVVKCIRPQTRIFHASTSEMFGSAPAPQNLETNLVPQSPYAIAKVASHHFIRLYRKSYKMFACAGITFNHESERRGPKFVTRKITMGVAQCLKDPTFKVKLGNLNAKRDWGYAPDFCINKDVPILTTSGWKCFQDIDIGEEIINFDPIKNSLSRDKVLEKYNPSLESSQKIILKGRGYFLKCTPNHRIYFQQKSKKSKGGWSNWKIISALDFYNKLNDSALMTKYDYRLPHFQNYDAPDLDIKDEKIYLVGALIAEGCLNQKRNARKFEISLSQSFVVNEKIHKKIENCLNFLGLEYYKRVRNDGVTEWVFNRNSSDLVCEMFDNSNIHIMPRWCYGLSKRQANILFDALMDCDGCWGSMTFSNKRSLVVADFQSIAHLSGYKTTAARQIKDGMWYVGIVSRRRPYSYITEFKIENDDETDVWCVKTKNGTIITRDNGCISISGNCEGFWMTLQQEKPDDYIFATNEMHTVQEFCEKAFAHVELNWEEHVVVDRFLMRPAEVDELCGDFSVTEEKIGWKPKVKFDDLIKIMVDYDCKLLGVK